MKSPNHIIGGFVFTGLFASLSGINIFASAGTVIVTVVGSLLPDIDYPKSAIGRLVLPLSRWINRHFGHRTITHSGLALVISTLWLALFEKVFFGKTHLSLVYFYAFFSHLTLDMMTLQGVPLLYPFFKNPFVLPGNPSFRIRTGDVKAETLVFCLFLLAAIWLQPLFKRGFWTSYNRLFGTTTHLMAEFSRSEHLLQVDYTAKKGSQILNGSGYCMSAKQNEVVLWEGGFFTILDKGDLIIERVVPTMTDQQFFFETHAFVSIDLDSLNRLVQDQIIAQIEVVAAESFQVWQRNRKLNNINAPLDSFLIQTEEAKHFTQQWAGELRFDTLVTTDSTTTSTMPFIYEPNPRIKILEKRLSVETKEIIEQEEDWQEHLVSLTQLTKKLSQETNPVQRDILFQQYQQALKLKPPKMDRNALVLLQTEIEQLRLQDSLKNLEKRLKLALQTKSDPPKLPLTFTGSITTIKID